VIEWKVWSSVFGLSLTRVIPNRRLSAAWSCTTDVNFHLPIHLFRRVLLHCSATKRTTELRPNNRSILSVRKEHLPLVPDSETLSQLRLLRRPPIHDLQMNLMYTSNPMRDVSCQETPRRPSHETKVRKFHRPQGDTLCENLREGDVSQARPRA